MKAKLLYLSFLLSCVISYAQPQIMGDLILCPNGEGTAYITTDQNYDSYQWYYKYWFEAGDFMAISGADEASFTYDWYTYDQALLKVVVTLNGETFESNTIQIDSYAFLPISMAYQDSENISMDPETGNVLLCTGTTFNVEVFNPYSANIQWYRNGVAISGANQMIYEVSAEGVYHVVASPQVCPEMIASTEGTPIIVSMNNECSLQLPENGALAFSLSPNPASELVFLSSMEPLEMISIYNTAGQVIYNVKPAATHTVDVSPLASGMYFIKAEAAGKTGVTKLVKQ